MTTPVCRSSNFLWSISSHWLFPWSLHHGVFTVCVTVSRCLLALGCIDESEPPLLLFHTPTDFYGKFLFFPHNFPQFNSMSVFLFPILSFVYFPRFCPHSPIFCMCYTLIHPKCIQICNQLDIKAPFCDCDSARPRLNSV